jgi:phosphoribosylformylglycinamidine synthase
VANEDVLNKLEAKNLVVLRYANEDGSTADDFPANPNGALNAIAGICDESGRIFGLMPHPEAFLSPFNSPTWTKEKLEGKLASEGEGVVFFRNAVNFVVSES